MQDSSEPTEAITETEEIFVEGLDFYFEDGLMVHTRRHLLKRNYCCESGCRHCPYGFEGKSNLK